MTEKEFSEKFDLPATVTVWECEKPVLYYTKEYVQELRAELKTKITWRKVEEHPDHFKVVLARWKGDRPYLAYYDKDTEEWIDIDSLIRNPDKWLYIPE